MVEDDGGPWVLADGRCITHADLRRGAARAASGFAALGVGEGDAVAILLGNGTPFLEAMLGATLVGAHPVPISPAAPPADVAFILADCAARLLVADAALADRVPPGPLRLPVADVAAWERWTSLHPPRAAPAPAFRGSIAYTSGTTGRPKGLRRASPPPGHRPARALMVYGFDRPGRAVALIDGPLHHSVPNAYARVALGAGADIVLRPGFDPEATLDAIARHRVTHLHLVPSAMARLLALPDAVRRRSDLSSLRHVVHGAAPCPPHVRRGMAEWWGPVLHEYYGSTETGLLTFHTEAEAIAAPGSVGRPLPGIALHVFDEEGHPLPPGAVGAVYAGSDTMADFTFIGAPERRAAIGRGDLVTAGDLGWLDAHGALHLAGRASEAVRVGGMRVHPSAVEAVLAGLPGVADCAVLGVPGPDGDELVACVSPRPGAAVDPEALLAGIAARVAPEAVPRRLKVLDALPREPSGKMVKRRLLEVLSAPSSPG